MEPRWLLKVAQESQEVGYVGLCRALIICVGAIKVTIGLIIIAVWVIVIAIGGHSDKYWPQDGPRLAQDGPL